MYHAARMGNHKRKPRHNRAISKRNRDTGDAFLESDAALQTAWERVNTLRGWMRLLDILPAKQRELLTHPENVTPGKEKE